MKLEHDYSMGRQCHASYNHSSATRTYWCTAMPLIINAENGSKWGLRDAGGMIHPGWWFNVAQNTHLCSQKNMSPCNHDDNCEKRLLIYVQHDDYLLSCNIQWDKAQLTPTCFCSRFFETSGLRTTHQPFLFGNKNVPSPSFFVAPHPQDRQRMHRSGQTHELHSLQNGNYSKHMWSKEQFWNITKELQDHTTSICGVVHEYYIVHSRYVKFMYIDIRMHIYIYYIILYYIILYV